LKNWHTSARELAYIAGKARPRLLVLYHQIRLGIPASQILAEIRKHYRGRVVYGNDLQRF
jgi:ribonuclease BN (tRNA processing enzyme)